MGGLVARVTETDPSVFRKLMLVSTLAEKPPISDSLAGTGKPSVFRHTLRVPDSHTFWRNAASGCESRSNARKSTTQFERLTTRSPAASAEAMAR
jgi:hypothetical protein